MSLNDFHQSVDVSRNSEPESDSDSSLNEDKINGFLLGMIAGEGSFYIAMNCHSDSNVVATPCFKMELHEVDSEILEYFCDNLGIGRINDVNRKDHKYWQISSVSESIDLAMIIESILGGSGFEITRKYESFQYWKRCLEILNKHHGTTNEEIMEIAKLRDKMNTDRRGRTADEIEDILN